MKVRVKFTKHGTMKFIGHLDIMRYFQKAFRRSELGISYTEGFSPHQIMSFAAPLGVGMESNGEYMDIEMKTVLSSHEMVAVLNATMARGVEIISMKKLPDTVGNAMASVQASKYSIYFKKNQAPGFDYVQALPLFYEKESIVVVKQTKKSEAELDLKPAIYEMGIRKEEADPRVNQEELEELPAISMVVDSSSSGNIKPSLVMEAFFKENNEELKPFSYLIVREETYAFRDKTVGRTGMSKDEILENLIPMDQLGENIDE